MSRQKFGNESAHLTKWIPAGQIEVDPMVQRPLNIAWAEKIGRDLDPDLIGVLHVSDRSNGRYVVIDGQHRLHGVKNVFGNNGTLVECKVYTGLSRAQEAELFVGLNDFKRPTRFDVFQKNVVAKETHACAIDHIVRAAGFRVERAQADGTITAIGALEEVYFGFTERRRGKKSKGDDAALERVAKPNLLKDTLLVLREAWGVTADAVNGHLISGVGRLLAARQRAMELPELISKLAKYPGGPSGLLGAAAGLRGVNGGKVSHSVAEVCLELYNRGRRVSKLEPLR